MPAGDPPNGRFQPGAAPNTSAIATDARKLLSSRAIRRQAGFIAAFCHKALLEMSESLSFSGEDARDNAAAVNALVRSWEAGAERLRIESGRPLPGSRRPAQEPAKGSKRRPTVLPPVARPAPPATPKAE